MRDGRSISYASWKTLLNNEWLDINVIKVVVVILKINVMIFRFFMHF